MTAPIQPQQALLTIPQACEYLGGISRCTLYRRAKEGHIRFVHIGRRSFISTNELDTYIESLAEAVAAQ